MKRINKFIGDPRFLLILNKFLKAGFIEPKTGEIVNPESGSTQGGVLSPLLCNIVLHELDKYMADTENKFSKGKTRKINPVDKSLANKRFSSNDSVERLNLLSEMRKTRRSLMAEHNYRRLDYIRYAEDFIVLVSGSFKDAKFIQNNIKDYIKANCGLELNQNKTVISNILKDEWSFLGAKMKKLKINPELLPTLLVTGPNPTIACALRAKGPTIAGELRAKGEKLRCLYYYKNKNKCTSKNKNDSHCNSLCNSQKQRWRVKHVSGTQVGTAKLLVNAPIDKLLGNLKKSGFVRQNKLGKFIPKAYTSIVNLTHYEIVSFYNSKIHGIINFYNFASNRSALGSIF
jgi:Type II intron maturase/Reverse transcriptase (RNA-dependent DNA polymerase)